VAALAKAEERFAGDLGQYSVVRNDLQLGVADQLVQLLPGCIIAGSTGDDH
jgi:hypothetical protein